MGLACWLSLQLATPVILSMNKGNRRPRIVAEGSCSDALLRLPAPLDTTPRPGTGRLVEWETSKAIVAPSGQKCQEALGERTVCWRENVKYCTGQLYGTLVYSQ